ncbi:MAG: acyl-CoA thioesterase [Bdellovibrio sp.]|jgi:acyl-CoA thioesterase FadM
MAKTYQKQIQIRFREGDPARIMYFRNVFDLAHDCFEDFIQAQGLSWSDWFDKNPCLVPIRHVEADFLAPFIPGETYTISTVVAQIRDTSFQMKYVFEQNAKVHAVVTMVHAYLDPKTQQKTKVQEQIRNLLTPYLEA